MSKVNARSLGRNSLFAGIAQFWQIGSRLVLTPLVIAQVGLAGYGTWTLLFSLTAYVSMFNSGFALAYVNYTAQYDNNQQYRKLTEALGSGIALTVSLGLLAFGLFWNFSGALLGTLNVPENLTADAGVALLVVSGCLVLRMSYGAAFEVLSGLQRIDLNYKLHILASFIEFGVTLFLLLADWGLLGLAIGYACGQVVSTALAIVACRMLCPALRFSPFYVTREGLRNIGVLGGRFQLLAVINTFTTEGVKVLMAVVLGTAWVGIYELAKKLIQLCRSVSGSLLGPLMPAFASLHAGRDQQASQALFIQGSKLISIVATFSLIFLVLTADRLLLLWTGEQVPEAAWTARMLAPATFFVLLTGVATARLRGQGEVMLEIYYALLGSLMIVLAIFPLYHFFAYSGIVYALLISNVISSLAFLLVFFHYAKLPLVDYFKEVVIKVAGYGIVASFPVLALRYSFYGSVAPETWSLRWWVLLEMAVYGAVYLVAFGWLVWGLVLDTDERAKLKSLLVRKRVVSGA